MEHVYTNGGTSISLSKAITNTGEFFLGFLMGSLIEYIAIRIYTTWDPKKMSNLKLFTVSIVGLFVICLVSQNFQQMTKFGLFSSQIFIFDYAFTRFYNPIKNL